VHAGRPRLDGFNRAKHAVLGSDNSGNATASDPGTDRAATTDSVCVGLEKTSGSQERLAFDLVVKYIDDWYRDNPTVE